MKDKKYSERTVDKWFVKAVKEAHGLTFKNHPVTEKGIPDRIVHDHSGKTIYVELKATGEECSDVQIAFQRRLLRNNIPTIVLDTKIEKYADLFKVGYTTYSNSNLFENNPHRFNGRYES